VQILLLQVPKLLRDLLERTIRLREGWELVRDKRPTLETLTEPCSVPDVVVLGLSGDEDTLLVSLVLTRWPLARVVTISDDGERVEIANLTLQSRELLQPTPETLVSWFDKELGVSERAH
jgi:hypothetical protein